MKILDEIKVKTKTGDILLEKNDVIKVLKEVSKQNIEKIKKLVDISSVSFKVAKEILKDYLINYDELSDTVSEYMELYIPKKTMNIIFNDDESYDDYSTMFDDLTEIVTKEVLNIYKNLM